MTPPTLAALATSIEPLLELGAPADEAALLSAEGKLGVSFPDELRELLLEANGATVRIRLNDGKVIPAATLYWTVAEIVDRNLSSGAPRSTPSLWFADVGADGMLFGHPRSPDGTVEQRVVVWTPLDDSASEVAPNLREWLTGWVTGTIDV